MAFKIAPLPLAELADYATVPISFLATHRLLRTEGGVLSPGLVEPLADPFVKDYDQLPGMSPVHWPARFQLRDWGLFVAREGGVVVGGAAVAPSTEAGVRGAAIGKAPALLWDLRVAPAMRGRRVGTALFHAAEAWAADRRHATLSAESQDINVTACLFYQAMGCTLTAWEPQAYPELPNETRVVWRRDLVSRLSPSSAATASRTSRR